jgi:hypothetical protein
VAFSRDSAVHSRRGAGLALFGSRPRWQSREVVRFSHENYGSHHFMTGQLKSQWQSCWKSVPEVLGEKMQGRPRVVFTMVRTIANKFHQTSKEPLRADVVTQVQPCKLVRRVGNGRWLWCSWRTPKSTCCA